MINSTPVGTFLQAVNRELSLLTHSVGNQVPHMRQSGPITTKNARDFNIDELYELAAQCQSPGQYQLCIEELQRRYLEIIGRQTKRLADSSDKLEGLTIRLNTLTWVLIVLTALAVLTPIGIEVWKAHHEIAVPQTVPVLEPRKPSP